MPNYRRYSVASEWSATTDGDEFCRIDTATLRDKTNGATYPHGAYRVVEVATGKTLGTFFGETAWSAAECLVNDRYFAPRGRS